VIHYALSHIHRLTYVDDFIKLDNILFFVILAAINKVHTTFGRYIPLVPFQPITFKLNTIYLHYNDCLYSTLQN